VDSLAAVLAAAGRPGDGGVAVDEELEVAEAAETVRLKRK
jgi:hypothetical protein